jgi:FkbM family methyltransferase
MIQFRKPEPGTGGAAMTTFTFQYDEKLFSSTDAVEDYIHGLVEQGSAKVAEQVAVALAQAIPGDLCGLRLYGETLLAQGRPLEAEPVLVHAFNSNTACLKTGKALLTAVREIGRDNSGLMVAQHLLSAYPDDPELLAAQDYFSTALAERGDPGFYMQFFDEDDLVFDIGANIGAMTAAFLRDGAGRVVSVEPQPPFVETLQRKFARTPAVTVVPMAISDRVGEITFSICSEHPSLSTCTEYFKHGRYGNYVWDRQIQVQTTTLDTLIAQFGRPTYCKIDVEGFEETVLKGLSQPLRYLSFEFSREFLNHTANCVQRLEAIGFSEFNAIVNAREELAFDPWLSAADLLEALHNSPDQLLVGDIFAHCPSLNADANE